MTASDDELLTLVERVAGRAGDGEQVEVVAIRSRDTEIRVYEGDVEQLSSAESAGIGVRVLRGHRQGLAYAGTLEEDALDEVLAEARENAAFGTPDEFLGLAEPDGVEPVDLDLWREALGGYRADAKVDLALELERAVRAADARVTAVKATDYADSMTEAALASSVGIRSSSRATTCYVSTSVLAADGEETQTGYGYSIGRQPGDLDVDRAAGDASDRATRMLGATKPQSGRTTVVFEPRVTAQFLGILGGTLSGEAVLKGRSLFAERVGEDVGAAILTLVDDPTNRLAYGASRTDGEGLATRPNLLIEKGVLQGFLHNAYTGRRLGGTSTGSAVRGFKSVPGVGARALALTAGPLSPPDLWADIEDGVLIQTLKGLHSGVNAVSGDFSVGAEGLRIRGGAPAEPLREFTIASTIQKMLKDVTAVGSDVEWLPMRAAGVSLVVADVTLSGR
ncbi:MAG: TldD/PmbA family protein [Acidimicrobiales bacterium]